MVPLTLAVATDALLKNEFDAIRGRIVAPIWEKFNLNVSAYAHDEIENWRNNFRGMRIFHEATNMEIFGAVDDICNTTKRGISTLSTQVDIKKGEPTIEGGGFGDGYKRQMEIYQWLFNQAGFDTSSLATFFMWEWPKIKSVLFRWREWKHGLETAIIEYDEF